MPDMSEIILNEYLRRREIVANIIDPEAFAYEASMLTSHDIKVYKKRRGEALVKAAMILSLEDALGESLNDSTINMQGVLRRLLNDYAQKCSDIQPEPDFIKAMRNRL